MAQSRRIYVYDGECVDPCNRIRSSSNRRRFSKEKSFRSPDREVAQFRGRTLLPFKHFMLVLLFDKLDYIATAQHDLQSPEYCKAKLRVCGALGIPKSMMLVAWWRLFRVPLHNISSLISHQNKDVYCEALASRRTHSRFVGRSLQYKHILRVPSLESAGRAWPKPETPHTTPDANLHSFMLWPCSTRKKTPLDALSTRLM